ncbi:acyl CoA:acetate/3-ketoacid CoA transferase [Salinarimonas rosea]|uniref:acyl CoA:acetate/3-ketoacid CoA transferase n=1 Tax=Salinarimonas rosea TaxID=552063 RepID=UPI00040A17DE|nr:malonate decarboxylase subunit alpha [Salinarimonas rosea]
MRIVTATQAAGLVPDGATVIPGGFGCCGNPEAVLKALGARFRAEGRPRNLTLLFAAGPGDRGERGLNHLAQEGLVSRAIGGFWGFAPKLGRLAEAEALEAHNWPQGVVSHLFRAMAARLPGIASRVGLETFVDPDQEGGRMNARAARGLVRKTRMQGRSYLLYPALRADVAIIRGTRADRNGNICMDREVSFQDALSQAQAAHNSGGIVIAQVADVTDARLDPHAVSVPGCLVDYIVVADPEDHMQTWAEAFNPAYVGGEEAAPEGEAVLSPLVRRIIARRAARELAHHPGAIVNLGIGIPAEIGRAAAEAGLRDFTLTIESGQFGGVPASGLSFGAAANPQAKIDQAALFDLYDGGGLDIAFLGFAEADSRGNVNVSRFQGRMPGIGGFANISGAAKRVVFCGSLTAEGLEVEAGAGRLAIRREGRTRKLLRRLDTISFNGPLAESDGRQVTFVTERAVFELVHGCLRLTEVAPGIDVRRDIVEQIEAGIVIGQELKTMDPALFH